MGARAVIAGIIGALCGAGLAASLKPANDAVCGGHSLACLGTFLLVMPVMVIVMAFVGWGLLAMARFTPAWPTAIGGPVGAVALLIATGALGDWTGVNLLPFGAAASCAVITATGYALAGALTAGYGGTRD